MLFRYNFLWIMLWLCCTLNLLAVNDLYPAGARSLGMAQLTVNLKDAWSGINNQAASAFVDQTSAGIAYKNLYFINTIGIQHALINIHTQYGMCGVNYQQIGYAGYLDSKAGLYYARKFGAQFAAGLQFDLLMVKPSYEEAMLYQFTGEVSFMAKANDKLSIGFHVYNPLAIAYQTTYFDEKVPVIARLGLEYTISDQVFLVLEGEGHSENQLNMKLGLEYKIAEGVAVRVGAGSEPVQITFGLGVLCKGFKIDMAVQQLESIGRSAGISLTYDF